DNGPVHKFHLYCCHAESSLVAVHFLALSSGVFALPVTCGLLPVCPCLLRICDSYTLYTVGPRSAQTSSQSIVRSRLENLPLSILYACDHAVGVIDERDGCVVRLRNCGQAPLIVVGVGIGDAGV